MPAMAVAAATAGETRWVRPPRPWRPSKLRLEVDAQRSPGASLSGFIARHIEQPGSRQSKPAAVKILSRPSASACASPRRSRGRPAPASPSTCLPSTTAAAARRSSMRLFVHEPMNTVSTADSLASACRRRGPCTRGPARRRPDRSASANDDGIGHATRRSRSPAPGSCPTRRAGTSVAASRTTSLSNVAPSSVASVRQSSSACSQPSPLGACSRPSR